MIYQLSSGKIINITLEQFLDMTDNDEQFLRATNAGEYPRSIWQESSIGKKPKKTIPYSKEKDDLDIDYVPEEDTIPIEISLEEALPDEFNTFEDISEDID